ncbi:hypothetical protein [Candidatus Nitrotoga sp. BS]|uniref:hypothetical protein n=1 Tax=Candidatus Nitrotoga sp. BS TaxID=2890408 RepID=UPI001EF1AD8F|nr:hypothetical protein [Candidatus Nitrotoga sp. BS]
MRKLFPPSLFVQVVFMVSTDVTQRMLLVKMVSSGNEATVVMLTPFKAILT